MAKLWPLFTKGFILKILVSSIMSGIRKSGHNYYYTLTDF